MACTTKTDIQSCFFFSLEIHPHFLGGKSSNCFVKFHTEGQKEKSQNVFSSSTAEIFFFSYWLGSGGGGGEQWSEYEKKL